MPASLLAPSQPLQKSPWKLPRAQNTFWSRWWTWTRNIPGQEGRYAWHHQRERQSRCTLRQKWRRRPGRLGRWSWNMICSGLGGKLTALMTWKVGSIHTFARMLEIDDALKVPSSDHPQKVTASGFSLRGPLHDQVGIFICSSRAVGSHLAAGPWLSLVTGVSLPRPQSSALKMLKAHLTFL